MHPPSTRVSVFQTTHCLPNNASENPQAIVFVHGINNSEFDYENTSETMFKRLYWEGYRGRFSAFRWPSPTFSWVPLGPYQVSYFEFNGGEYVSWHSGAALKGYLADLKNRAPGYTINLAAHSLGNIAANESIREGASVSGYALMQAAVSALAFDGNNNLLTDAGISANRPATPDGDSLGGYRGCFSTLRACFENAFMPNWPIV